MNSPDILIAGGGIAGLTATLALAQLGYSVTCCDAGPETQTKPDTRSTAFLQPSVALLEQLGVWDQLAPLAAELRVMRLADAGGPEASIRYTADFTAAEIGEPRFGWNIPNAHIRSGLLKALSKQSNASLCFKTKVTRLISRDNQCIATTSTGQTLRPKLTLAADGRDSELRETAGIKTTRSRYGQKAVVFTVAHAQPHEGISTEIHRSGGPFTLVPLPDQNGQAASAVVWMENGPEATRLAAISAEDFTQALNERACNVLGPLTLTSDRAIWPIISQQAKRLCEGRMALLAEAAHAMPPIGAQGLNTSLADIIALTDLLASQPPDPGNPEILAKYERLRLKDIEMRVTGVSLLNRAAQSGNQSFQDIRRASLRAIAEIPALKATAMRKGLGIDG